MILRERWKSKHSWLIVIGCQLFGSNNWQPITNLTVGLLQRVECGMMQISNRKILALLMIMLMSSSGSVYAANAGNRSVRVLSPNTTQNVRISRPVQVGNTSAQSSSTAARTVQPKEVLSVMIGNPIKNQIPVYTSLTSGKIARYFNVNEVGHCESNAYFLDVTIYNNGYAEVTYFNKQYKDIKIYVKASDLSTGSGMYHVNSLPVKMISGSTPLYTDAYKSKVMYTMEPGRNYKVLTQQGNMQQVYSYGKGQYSAIGWISIASSSGTISNGSRISSTGLRGDINGDGQVNSNDLALLKQYLNNSTVVINKTDADMNNDGVIDSVDYNYLIYFLNPRQPVLKGDANGDGKVDEIDYKLLNQFISGQKVSNFYHYNADLNNDKKFTTTDLSQLRSKIQATPPQTDKYTVFTIPNGWYEIAPLANENMRLDVDDGKEGNGVTIKLFTRNGHAAQRFYVRNLGNGYFTMQTGCNGYVDLKYGETGNGTNIWQYEKEAANGKCQKFRAIRRNNESGVYIEPMIKQGLAITCVNHSAAPQTNIVIWNRENSNYQKWKFIQTGAVMLPVNVKEGLYSIQPMCAPSTELTVSGASKNLSTPVIIYSQNSSNQTTKSHQKWYVTSVGNGYYKITAENSGLALNNHNGANVNGNPISIYTYSGYCQEFRFYDAGNGYYAIQPKNTSGVLDVVGGGNANNTRVQLYQYNSSAAQKWKLVPRNRGVDPDPYKQWDAYPKRTCNVYTDSALTKRTPGVNEYVDTSDPVTVLGETGNAYYIRYKAKSGYKDRWVTKDIFKENEGRNWVFQGNGPFTVTTLYKYSRGTRHSCRYYTNGVANGMDIGMPYGTKIFAPYAGVVQRVQNSSTGFGNCFEIKHDDGVISLYGHMSKIHVSNGQYVNKGDLIGEVGSTGNSSGNHLHFEFSNMNPYEYYRGKVQFKVVNRTDK